MLILQYLSGGFLAALLAFFLLPAVRKKDNKIGKDSAKIQKEGEKIQGEGSHGCVTDVIIIGAGVAGSALANALGKGGRNIHVIERDLTEPDRIVGELLQPGGYLKLIELGLEDCVKEIDAQRILGYALFKDGKDTKMPYPLEKFDSDVAGRSFHNGRFIKKMREKAATLPK